MIATILDTVTELVKTVNGPRPFEWTEGNYSCDCNRNPWGVDTGKPEGYCEGAERFLVVAAMFEDGEDTYSLRELNQNYPDELLLRWNIT